MPGTHQLINAYEQIKEFYEGTKAAIEAETGVPEGSWGHATDGGGDIGYYLGGWIWQSDITGIPLSYLDTDGTLAANSDVKIATQKATKTYVDTNVTGLLDFKGATDCSGNPNYPAALKGDAYVVSVAGKIGGASGKPVDVGDVFVASADNAGGTEAAVGTSWFVLEHNLQGALLAANNLSDVASASTSRTNLGLGALAVLNSLGINDLDDVNLADLADAVLLYYVADDSNWQCLPLSLLSSSHSHTNIPNDGWIADSDTWTRTGNHTYTKSGDHTATHRKGMKIRYKDGGAFKYGVIGSSSVAAGTTTINLIPNTNYLMAAATITDKFISPIENPEGFPHWFDFDAAPLGFSIVPSSPVYRWTTKDRTIYIAYVEANNGTSNATTFTATAPIAPTQIVTGVAGTIVNNGVLQTTPGRLTMAIGSTTITFRIDMGLGAWTNANGKRLIGYWFYEF